MKKILFVCKYNRFRSKIAEAYFKKVNKNKNIKAQSAGVIIGRPIDKLQKKVAKSLEINLEGEPQGLTSELLIWQNVIIIVADDVPLDIFNNEAYGKKTIVWKIPDENANDKEKVKILIKLIMKKVEDLVKQLEKEK